MKRPVVTAVAGIIAILVSIALALLGRAVLATPAAVDRAGTAWPERVHVATRDTDPFDRAAASLVGTGHAGAFDQIVAIYRNAVALQAAAGDPRGPVGITRLIPRLHSSQERAQALVMAGTLLAYSAGAGFGVILPRSDQAATATVLDQAREDYRAAIRDDPGNETAKYDLELLLRQQRAQSAQRPQAQKRKKAPARQDRRQKTTRANGEEHHAGIYATGSGY